MRRFMRRVADVGSITPGLVRILDRDTTTNDVVGTITETTVYTFSVPGGSLSTNRALRLTLVGDYLNNTGAGSAFTIRGRWGGTLAFTANIASVAQDTTRRLIFLPVVLSSRNAVSNAQLVSVDGMLGLAGSAGSPPTTFDGQANIIRMVNNGLAVDSTANQTLAITFEHGTADANISARALSVQLEQL